uniref:G-protein coupled receptors family 1 profile domain-containing protein n=1 Tax=Mustela putorius furo TaxID=9669 RepID=M3YTI7_MUSPF
IVMTMMGNLVVIISIAHFKQLQSPTNFLILSMATTDFLLSCVVMPFSMVRSIESCWYFGDLFCKVHSCCDIMLCTTSIFHLCFISVDRYYAVCDPLHYVTRITIPVIEVFLFISWSIPIFFAFGLVFSELSIIGLCVLIFNKLWGVLASFIAFFLPGTVMVGIYVHIFTVARKHGSYQETGMVRKQNESIIQKKINKYKKESSSQLKKKKKERKERFGTKNQRADYVAAGATRGSRVEGEENEERECGEQEGLRQTCQAQGPQQEHGWQAQQINTLSKNLAGATKRERKAAKTLGIAVGIYLLCWLPFTIDTLVDSLLNFITPPLIFDIFIWFAYFNSACNPIIYVFSYRWFRKALKLCLSGEIF